MLLVVMVSKKKGNSRIVEWEVLNSENDYKVMKSFATMQEANIWAENMKKPNSLTAGVVK